MCSDPKVLEGFSWLVCYLTTPKHQAFYYSFLTILALVFLSAPAIMLFGFLGAFAKRSSFAVIRWIGSTYTAMVRGIPDIVFFMFVPIAIDQLLEVIRHKVICPDAGPVRQGNDFVVCAQAKLPLGPSPEWVHDTYGFLLALLAFAIVFGAFAANVLDGALRAVPKSQLETAKAYGMTQSQVLSRIHLPLMWRYALPGLSNLWMILIKATPLLFLLGIEDAVYWARELGGAKTSAYAYAHPDWRLWYFLSLLAFYLVFTYFSEVFFSRLTQRVSKGQSRETQLPTARARSRQVGLNL